MNRRIELATGIAFGENPSEQSIKQGLVRMEEHPDFDKVIESLEKDGFIVAINTNPEMPEAYVVFDLETDGHSSNITKAVVTVPGMRWLDLEHELGHIEQIMSRFICQGFLAFREVKHFKFAKKVDLELKNWQIVVFEFHERLEEFIRMYERGVRGNVLREHAVGLSIWSDKFWKNATRKWRSQARYDWIMKFFPDIFEYRKEAATIIRSEFPGIGRIM